MSNATLWTPGPWEVEPIQHIIDKATAMGEAFYTASILPKAEPFRGYTCHMQSCEHIGGITAPECEANARLIAAAPEMAALLERYVECEFVSDLLALDDKARALLAKIKG